MQNVTLDKWSTNFEIGKTYSFTDIKFNKYHFTSQFTGFEFEHDKAVKIACFKDDAVDMDFLTAKDWTVFQLD